VGGDVPEEMCKRNSGGDEKGKGEATSDRRRIWESVPAKKVRSNLPELTNTAFLVVICLLSNGKDIVLSPNQLQAANTDVRHWEQLIDFINNNGRPKEPYTRTSRFKCTMEKDELDQEYMGVYKNGQMITDPYMARFRTMLPFKCF